MEPREIDKTWYVVPEEYIVELYGLNAQWHALSWALKQLHVGAAERKNNKSIKGYVPVSRYLVMERIKCAKEMREAWRKIFRYLKVDDKLQDDLFWVCNPYSNMVRRAAEGEEVPRGCI